MFSHQQTLPPPVCPVATDQPTPEETISGTASEHDGEQSAVAPPLDHTAVFLSAEALAINEARLCHLASLGLDIAGKRVLEVGGGIGLHTCFFESLGCEVLFTEARLEYLHEALRRYPHRKGLQLDLDQETDLRHLGRFDIVYCYGTLYHLSKPAEALQALSEICDGMILLETCVTPGDDDALHREMEPSSVANQAASGLGCRPTRTWVMRRLEEFFGHSYQTITQPQHHDFECNWLSPEPSKLYRAVFVGSKSPLSMQTLSDVPCELQVTVPDDSAGAWFDVGAHLGETTFEFARQHPELRVYAFEPNLEVASKSFNQLANFNILPMAVGEHNGFARFHINTFTAASSLLPLDESRHRQWIGGEQLQQAAEVLVPCTRLDTFLEANDISQVDYLKIDAQGADFYVLLSAGDRLKDIRKIKVEVTITPTQLYVGGASKGQVIEYLTERGFVLISEQSQTHGQEENLVFFQLGSWPRDFQATASIASEWAQILGQLTDQQLLATARSLAELKPLGPVPDWVFGRDGNSLDAKVRLRETIWKICNERKLESPIDFPWFDGARINLYLGNDQSYPTFLGGRFEPNEFAFVDSFLKPGMVFVDVGANEGFYSVFASRRIGPTGRLLAFEPSQREFTRLNANLQLNNAENARSECVALADAAGSGELKLCEYGHEGQNTLGDFGHAVHQSGTQTVELMSLDAYCDEHPLERLDFIKIDVEGAEQRVLEGARRTLAKFRPVILLELNDKALQFQHASCESVVNLLRSLEYSIYSFSPATGLPVPANEQPYSDNVVAAPSEIELPC